MGRGLMRRSILHFLVQAVFVGSLLAACSQDNGSKDVSIQQLHDSPSKYSQKTVRIKGFLSGYGGWLILYPSKEDALMVNNPVGLLVIDSSPGKIFASEFLCVEEYSEVVGEFGFIDIANVWGITELHEVSNFTFDDETSYREDCYSAEKGYLGSRDGDSDDG